MEEGIGFAAACRLLAVGRSGDAPSAASTVADLALIVTLCSPRVSRFSEMRALMGCLFRFQGVPSRG